MPIRQRSVRSSLSGIVLAALGAASLLVLAGAPPVLAAGPRAGATAALAHVSSSRPPACTTQTVVVGVLPDLRTVTATLRDAGASGRRQATVATGRLPSPARAVAALDPTTF